MKVQRSSCLFLVLLILTSFTSCLSNVEVHTPPASIPIQLSDTKDITGFSIAGSVGSINGTNISVTVPYGTDVTLLTPTISITGSSVSPLSGIVHDFTSPSTYIVTAANGSIKVYTVTVTAAPSTAKNITAFSILGVPGTIGTNTIVLTVPYGTDVTSLTPTISITGASVSPDSGVSQNFTSPVTYTVTAADSSTKDYTVTVSAALNSSKNITAFSFDATSPASTGTINGTSITVTVPYGTDLSSLTPTVSITGASVSPASGVLHNFTSPVTYTVTAADNSTKDYTVTVTEALNTAKDITSFSILGVFGTVGANTIALTVPYGTDVTDLTPTISITGSSVSPNSGESNNFTSPVTYTVTAADSSTKDYTVTVTVAASPAKEITALSILGVAGTVGEDTVTLTVPYGTDVTDLTPSITITGASVSPASGVPHSFASPATYTVTAADNSTKDYTVTVAVAASPAKNITAFSIFGVAGTVGANTIALTVPYGTDVTNLTPTIAITGASVSPASGVPHNFTSPATYTVTAADSSTKDYTVTVTVSNNVTYTADGVSFSMAHVPGGLTFPTGTSDTGTATVSGPYLVSWTEVTYELWNKVYTWALSNGYSFANPGVQGMNGGVDTTDQHPVTSMNWHDAVVWLNALTEWYNAQKGTNYTCAYYSDAAYTQPIRTSTNNLVRGTIKTVTLNRGGSGYPNGSVAINIIQAGASGGTVTATVTGGIVRSIVLNNVGTDYYYATALTTSTGGTGTGCKINVTEINPNSGTDGNPYVKTDATGFRMLTGNEWELAARYKDGVSWTPGNYASGATAATAAEAQQVAWYSTNSGSKTHVVATTPRANALGLYDMSGNAWEWVFGWYAGYVGSFREIRGGCWLYDSNEVGFSYGMSHDAVQNVMGFRVARTDL